MGANEEHADVGEPAEEIRRPATEDEAQEEALEELVEEIRGKADKAPLLAWLVRGEDQWHLMEPNAEGASFTASLPRSDDSAPSLADRFNQADKLFALELSGSSSLNTRGTTLAGLIGATLALLANLADSTAGLPLGVVLALVVAVGCLLVAGGSALKAVWPASTWRHELKEYQYSLAHDEPWDDQIRGLLMMTELQRLKNEAKALWMRLAYLFLGVAGVLVGGAAGGLLVT